MKKTTIIAIITVLFIGCKSTKKTEDTFEQLTKFVDQYANNTLEKGNINALAVAFYKNGKIYHNYYGEESKVSNKKLNDNTLFEIASISKVITGSIVAKAVLDKKISLEDDIRQYLKGEYPNLEFENIPITIKNLLTHTLGFKNKKPKKLEEIESKIGEGFYENKSIEYSKEEFLKELKTVELDKKPGTVYAYNTVGSEILAIILEQIYNDSFENILKNYLDNLNMKNTYLKNLTLEQSSRILAGVNKYGKIAPKDKSALTGAGGGITSTLPDLVKFMKFQLESKDPIIKEATKKLFENDEDDKLGYLWDVDVAEEEGFYFQKTGTSHGTQSVILICPDTNYGLILIANSTTEKAFNNWVNLYNQIEKNLIKYPKINLSAKLKSKFIENKESATKEFKKLQLQKDKYYNTNLAYTLNNIGYELLTKKRNQEAIEIFELATTKFPENSNLFDSLGEAYFINKDYKNALKNYKKSFELTPSNTNAKVFIEKINKLLN